MKCLHVALLISLSLLVGLLFGLPLDAAETAKESESKSLASELEPLLKQDIVGTTLPLAEMQQYCTDRVPTMGQFDSAESWQAEADRLRRAVLDRIVFRGEAAQWRDASTKIEWLETIAGGPGYRIQKLRYEALPGMWIPALLYKPEKLSGKVPAVLNVNGHSPVGKVYHPKQLRCINQAKRGMLALNLEWVGMGQLRTDGFNHARMNQLDLCGTSGLAPFYLAMRRGLDILVDLPNTDPDRVAVTGLSGGGWQTIILSSLDTRVKLATPVAGYSSFRTRAVHLKDLGDSEQTPNDLATMVDYTHLTAMMAPRPTLLTYNAKDNCCFESVYALKPLTDAAEPIFTLLGQKDRLRQHVNHDPGTHNYEQDNREAFYRVLGDFFYAQNEFNTKEIPSEDEIKTAEDLFIELPEPNHDFHTLALALSKNLPRSAPQPEGEPAASQWMTDQRKALCKLVRAKDYQVRATKSDSRRIDDLDVTFWRLRVGDAWTLPAVELVRGTSDRTAILVNDRGRANTTADAARLLADGYRVIAVDPIHVGECGSANRSGLFPLLVAGVGDRSLGLQASQLTAIARWATARDSTEPITLVARGPRTGIAALVAAALDEEAIGEAQLYETPASLHEVIDRNWTAREVPELFCFGLLESFDVKQLQTLAAPRPVTLH